MAKWCILTDFLDFYAIFEIFKFHGQDSNFMIFSIFRALQRRIGGFVLPINYSYSKTRSIGDQFEWSPIFYDKWFRRY